MKHTHVTEIIHTIVLPKSSQLPLHHTTHVLISVTGQSYDPSLSFPTYSTVTTEKILRGKCSSSSLTSFPPNLPPPHSLPCSHSGQVFLHQEITSNNGLIFRYIVPQYSHTSILIQIIEKRNRLSSTPSASCRWIDDLVQCTLPFIVGPATHQIAQINNEGILDIWHICPCGWVAVFAYL